MGLQEVKLFHGSFLDIYNKMVDLNISVPTKFNEDLVFLFRKTEKCFVMYRLPKLIHVSSVHFHPEENKVVIFYGGDGFTMFDNYTSLSMDDPEDVISYLQSLQPYL